jgi:hypothetical protein
MSVGELAAMTWLTETLTQRDVMQQFGARMLSLDFDAFLADVGGNVQRVLAHFAVPVDDGFRARLEQSPVLTRNSKAPHLPYSPELRRTSLDESRGRHQEQIRAGLHWIDRLARSETAVADVMASTS